MLRKERGHMKNFSLIIGRLLIGIVFLLSGFGDILYWNEVVQHFHQQVTFFSQSSFLGHSFESFWNELLQGSMLLVGLGVVIKMVGGFFILIGYRVRLGAVLLILFLIPITPLFHPFWFLQGVDASMQWVMFFKNIAVMGGLFCLLSIGNGKCASPPKPKAS